MINTLENKTVKTDDDIQEIKELESQRNKELNDIERSNNEVKKVEISYEVLISEKTEQDKYRMALLNVIKGERVNRTQCQFD